ncbi:alpha/beta fold hydrolase [Williamsia sterculiae]|uniref:Pimeloyl-ACP methyl ester carboxylesterase n=1 Tax=Williamsia sterculiae TaxID=1344003 RepID=A0A1N7EN16_9NOCA|nr:alpha/beta hydrolase [Williamsia sterculiae]SIR89459.1 Pimeloyl-ACP methyl ester carboxylesterase [Williamsia sterculiae]
MSVVTVSSGPIEYEDTGGPGPVIVLCHGVPMDSRCWRKVVPLLSEHRVVTPTLPMGGHRRAQRPDADLSQPGMAVILADFLEALDLRDVTLVLNDWGGGQFLISSDRTERVGRLVLAACEAFDNFPPGPVKPLSAVGKRVPAILWVMLQSMRIRPIRRMRNGYGGMSVVGIPDDLLSDWFRPARDDRQIRRDFVKFFVGTPPEPELHALQARWPEFTRPVLVVWAAQDRLMPAAHGPRLAQWYPNARLEIVQDSSTLLGEDQPERCAALIADFASEPRRGP